MKSISFKCISFGPVGRLGRRRRHNRHNHHPTSYSSMSCCGTGLLGSGEGIIKHNHHPTAKTATPQASRPLKKNLVAAAVSSWHKCPEAVVDRLASGRPPFLPQMECSVAVQHASQPSGVVPLLTCKGYM
jgi:hypothetical protein